MRQNHAVLVALFFFALAPAFADLVNVTVDGTVTGSGMVAVRCDRCGGPGEDSFSFAGSNAQVGTFSKSGQASFISNSPGVRSVTESGLTEQATAVSANSVSVDFLVSTILDGWVNSGV